ncbi:helix-turn-helix domain-containing protein [Bacteroides faecis]|uniref:helix-turn-helix domain-containing protein n=1 Tax=Bacteroides faecis TaxID=674529 RepID=UPI001D05F80F|nr:helix-turn-helix domain-containing protein [Bacteroides faecis]MCB6632058.1 helix-turn-helix domain-containing protein [Bacteroides faecis]MCE8939869.1 helix-turn-helix domain-containing protein [Bacteroides faecis]
MKYKSYLIAILWGIQFCFTLPVSAQNTIQQQKDSLRRAIEQSDGTDKLRSYNRLYYLYMSEIADDRKMDTLLTLFGQTEAEAIRQGNVKMQGMVYGNTIISHINRNEYDKIIQKAPGYLDFYILHEQWKLYYQIHMQLITAYNLKGDYKKAAEEAKLMFDRAKARKDKAGMATALYATAITYNVQDRWKEEEDCFRECIRLLWEVSGYDNILTQAYAFLCSSLRAQGQYDNLLQLVPEYEKAIARFEKAAGRTQPEAWGNLYVALMNTYIDTKDYDKAGEYLAKLEGIVNNNISRYELARAKALILQSRGDYRKALAAIDSAAVEVQESEFDLNAVRKIKMEILTRMGRFDEAFTLFDTIIAANDTIKDVEINARFDELRTQYEVEKHIAEKERNLHYFLFTLGICLVLALLLTATFYYNRIIALKNHKLYERIKEQDRLANAVETAKATDTLSPSSEQKSLVMRLQEYLLSGENLSNADMNRDDIISALGTNRNTLTEAVKAVTGKSPMEYTRFLKIEEARRMLDSHPEFTIEAVAFSCGFNIPSTFYRLFRKQYGISPAEYRKMANSSPQK